MNKKATSLMRIIGLLSFGTCVFQIATAANMPLQTMPQRALHLGLMFTIMFLYEIKSSGRSRIKSGLLLVFAVLTAASALYIVVNWLELQNRTTQLIAADYFMGMVMIAAILFLTWRSLGIWMPLIAIVFLIYAFVGQYLPGIFRFSGINLRRLISCLYCGTEGIFGTCVGASATYVFMFILFGEFLLRYGAGKFFIELADSLLGRLRGGTGKIAVVTSALFGMVSGSPTANVAATGCLTIPMMKKSGYSPEYSGGVVAAAAAGGSIMPPVMGTGAFVMAELIGVSYSDICIAAIFPAVLYFAAILLMVDVNAKKNGYSGRKSEQKLILRQVFRDGSHYLLCIAVLVLFLIVLDYSPAKSALISISVLIAADVIRAAILKQSSNLKHIPEILIACCKSAIPIAAATACAGLIVGTFTATGLNLRLSSVLIDLSGGASLVLLLLSAVAAIILGMGLPATPVYILMAVMVAPTLTKMGIPKLAAHLFVFYFGAMAPITPPVGTAFYVAAGIAKSNSMKTGLVAWYTALVAFLLPFIWVYQPAFLLDGSAPEIILAIVTGVIGIAALSFGLEGYLFGKLGPAVRILIIFAAVFTVIPETISTLLGMAIIFSVALRQWSIRKAQRA